MRGRWSTTCLMAKVTRIAPEGEEYFGEFVNGIREGTGTLLLLNGDIYEGQF